MREGTVERWERIALAAVKQCRRATVPTLEAPRAFSDAIGRLNAPMKLLLAEPSLDLRTRTFRDAFAGDVPDRVDVIVGPEGGWSSSEVAAAVAAGCLPVSLGTLTIRAESMAVAALAGILAVTSG